MATRTPSQRPPNTVYGAHRDETIIVLGNSASLRGMDHAIFDEFTTIGVNRILRTYEPVYLFVVDQSVIRDEFERMNESDCIKLIWPNAMSSKMKKLYRGPWISTGPMVGEKCGGDPTSTDGPLCIPPAGNSSYEAAHLAMRMGASRIAFAGVDMYWPPGKDTHFFGSGHKAGCKLPKADENIEAFARMKQLYSHIGVEMCSVSPWDTPFRRRMGYVPLEEL